MEKVEFKDFAARGNRIIRVHKWPRVGEEEELSVDLSDGGLLLREIRNSLAGQKSAGGSRYRFQRVALTP